MNLPAPFLPPNVDLRDFKFMPVDITRLFGSEFHAQADDSTWRAGMTLWLKSYHQVPAASMPDDDVALARLAELGRDTKTWKKVRVGALRGWTKCSDGRLYHKVVAEKALEAWIEKIAQRKVSAAGNCKRYKQEFDPAPYDADMQVARDHLHAINPQSRMLTRKGGKYALGSPDGSPIGSPAGSPDDSPDGSPAGVPREEKGREDKGSKSLKIEDRYLSPDGRATDYACALFFETFPGGVSEDDGVRRELGRRLSQGVPIEDLVEGAKRYSLKCAGRADQHIGSPVKWLVDGRWRDGARQAAPAAAAIVSDTSFVSRSDPNWERLSDRFRNEHKGKYPPTDSKGGWRFPNVWIAELHAGAA